MCEKLAVAAKKCMHERMDKHTEPWPLPLNIFEDKFAQFEVPQDDAIVVTMADGRHDLTEQGPGFIFTKALLLPHIGVEITKALVEEDVGPGLSQDDLLAGGDVLMLIHLPVRRQRVPVLLQRKHLHTNHTALCLLCLGV